MTNIFNDIFNKNLSLFIRQNLKRESSLEDNAKALIKYLKKQTPGNPEEILHNIISTCKRQDRPFNTEHHNFLENPDNKSFLSKVCDVAIEIFLREHPNLDINFKDPSCYNYTALHHAVKADNPKAVEAILNYRSTSKNPLRAKTAKVNSKNIKGQTPLHLACNEETKPEIIELLLKKKADPDLKDKHDWTPASLSCQRRYKKEPCFFLLKNHINIKKYKNYGSILLEATVSSLGYHHELLSNEIIKEIILLDPNASPGYCDGKYYELVEKINQDSYFIGDFPTKKKELAIRELIDTTKVLLRQAKKLKTPLDFRRILPESAAFKDPKLTSLILECMDSLRNQPILHLPWYKKLGQKIKGFFCLIFGLEDEESKKRKLLPTSEELTTLYTETLLKSLDYGDKSSALLFLSRLTDQDLHKIVSKFVEIDGKIIEIHQTYKKGEKGEKIIREYILDHHLREFYVENNKIEIDGKIFPVQERNVWDHMRESDLFNDEIIEGYLRINAPKRKDWLNKKKFEWTMIGTSKDDKFTPLFSFAPDTSNQVNPTKKTKKSMNEPD